MKFWLTLILGTILVSAFLTSLNLFKGAQTMSFPPMAQQAVGGKLDIEPAPTPAGKTAPSIEHSANVVIVDGGNSVVGERAEVNVLLKNSGDGPLQLSLADKSCTCSGIFLDGKEITLTDHVVSIPPGKSGILTMQWKPEIRHISDKFRYRASFEHNDPRYNEQFHFEVVSNVKPR